MQAVEVSNSSRRMLSPLLSGYPWSTGTLQREDIRSIVDSDHEMAPFLEQLHQFESALLFEQDDVYLKNTRRLLQVELADEGSGPVTLRPTAGTVPSGDKKAWSKLASVIFAYRIADVVAQLNDVEIPSSRKIERAEKAIKDKQLEGWARLEDWTALLGKFKAAVSREKPAVPFSGGNHAHIHLLKWLAHFNDEQHSSKIKANLVSAAIHLAFVRGHRFTPHEVPELTNDLNVLIATQFAENGPSMDLDLEELCLNSRELELAGELFESGIEGQRKRDEGSAPGRNPLHLALAVSPLYLLMPIRLSKLSVGRRNLLNTFFSLGNDKPPALVKVERAIWNVVFQLSSGKLRPDEATAVLCATINWDEIKACPTGQKRWFATSQDPSPLPSDSNPVQSQAVGGQLQQTSNPSVLPGVAGPSNSISLNSQDSIPSQSIRGGGILPEGSDDEGPDVPDIDQSVFGRKRRQPARAMEASKKQKRTHSRSATSGHSAKKRVQFLAHPTQQSEFWAPLLQDPFQPKKDVTLDLSSSTPILEGPEVLAFGSDASVQIRLQSRFHHAKDVDDFTSYVKAIEQNYENGMPLHLQNPEKSAIKTMTDGEFHSHTTNDIHRLLRDKCLLIRGKGGRRLAFDEHGLSTLGALHKVVTIQDHSIPVEEDGNVRLREGTLHQILQCSSQVDGKILNALQFPQAKFGYENDLSEHLSTEVFAWESTEGSIGCKEDENYPTADMRWGLAALKGAIHYNHIDSDGYGTYIDVKTGSKYWMILTPKSPDIMSRIGLFYDPKFDLNSPSTDLFNVEAVLLLPGDVLVMRPNTLHAVYSPDNAICWGGHYYATSTIQSTFLGIVHAFMAGSLVTNTEHSESRLLIRRIICFYHQALVLQEVDGADVSMNHAPNLASIDSAIDLLTACALGYLANALDFSTFLFPGQEDGVPLNKVSKKQWFEDDLNSMPLVKRKQCTYVRGVSRRLLGWFILNHQVLFNSGGFDQPIWQKVNSKDFACQYVADLLVAVKGYKAVAWREGPGSSGVKNCTLDMFVHQLDSCCPQDDPICQYKIAAEEKGDLDFPSLLRFSQERLLFKIERVDGRTHVDLGGSEYKDLHELGISEADERYYSYIERARDWECRL